jgi:diketogulonate reductase-like aldo/keto reductase
MRNVNLGRTAEKIPVIGQGTWGLSPFRSREYYNQWEQSLHRGIELGMTHIDTAEVYGLGKAEKVLGTVLAQYERENLFITSKLFPLHFTYNKMKKAAYNSLKRLGMTYFDLYLIHWPFPSALNIYMRVLEDLVHEGKTRYIGVSNYSVDQFKAAQDHLKKTELVTNQVNASVINQKHIHESLPYYQKEGITMTAYSPLGHRGLTNIQGDLRKTLEDIAEKHQATIQQIAIAWLVNMDRVITIPKAFQVHHVEANATAAAITLSPEEISKLSDSM